jgi:hypothetical protein
MVVVLSLALVLPAGSAFAACTDDLKIVKEQFKNVRDTRKRDLLKREISAADSALKHKSETNCKRAVMNAQRIMKQKP